MKIAIAADHGGFHLKREIIALLEHRGYEFVNFGTDSDASVDYPDFAKPLAQKVASGEFDRGILICGTGIGMSIAANKVPGVRCALVSDSFSARATREHNNSNVLALGQRVLGVAVALEIVDIWLTTDFEGGRHDRRVDKIEG